MQQDIGFKKGFTTGSCAQAAAKGACIMMANQKLLDGVEVETLSGVRLKIGLTDQYIGKDFARCSVIKDAGSDPDVTDKARICAEVRVTDKEGITIKGGEGVGKVTKPGLAVGIGEWAINPVPRKMILKEASQFLNKGNKGLEVTISVRGGEELAKKTFNPKLGIVGGISIIGTTGIVEPKSLDAYKASLALELNVLACQGHKKIILVLGYVGERYCKDVLKIKDGPIIKIGDHVGFMLEECAKKNIGEVLLIGHIGKMIKIASGQFNTHSKFGDNRIERIVEYAKASGANSSIVKEILRQSTAEATIGTLKKAGLKGVFDRIAKDVSVKARELIKDKLKVHCIVLSLAAEALGES